MEEFNNIELKEEGLDQVASGVRTAISESLEGELIKEYPVSFSIDTAFERLDSAFYRNDKS